MYKMLFFPREQLLDDNKLDRGGPNGGFVSEGHGRARHARPMLALG
jgi:hypothetical protein